METKMSQTFSLNNSSLPECPQSADNSFKPNSQKQTSIKNVSQAGIKSSTTDIWTQQHNSPNLQIKTSIIYLSQS